MKNTKRYDSIRAVAIKWTAEKFQVTREYVRGVVYGSFKHNRAEEILKAYKNKYAELKEVLK